MIIDDLFKVIYGQHEYSSKNNLKRGNTLLVSSKGTDNGCYGFFDILPKFNPPIITLPRTGSIGQAFVQIQECCVDDNCLVLIPKKKIPIEALFQIALLLRKEKWRFRYGRQITPYRIKNLRINIIKSNLNFLDMEKVLSPEEKDIPTDIKSVKMEKLMITDLFDIHNSNSKSFKKHKRGLIPFVTNGFRNNGIIGFVNPLNNERVFNTKSICVSSFCEATIQEPPFLPRGNGGSGLIVLIPKTEMSYEELFFYASQINNHGWRFSYGRMAKGNRIKKLSLYKPINEKRIYDKEYIKSLVSSVYGYDKLLLPY